MSNLVQQSEIDNFSQAVVGMSGMYDLVDISQLRVNKWNPNEMDAITFTSLKNSIRESGGNNAFPILVRAEKGFYEIIDGEHRYKAMLELDFKKVVVNILNLDEKDARLKTLAMDSIRGEFEDKKLANLLIELQNNFNVSDSELYNLTAITPDESALVKELLFKQESDEELGEVITENLKNNIRLYFQLSAEEYEILKKAAGAFKHKNFRNNFLYLCFYYTDEHIPI